MLEDFFTAEEIDAIGASFGTVAAPLVNFLGEMYGYGLFVALVACGLTLLFQGIGIYEDWAREYAFRIPPHRLGFPRQRKELMPAKIGRIDRVYR